MDPRPVLGRSRDFFVCELDGQNISAKVLIAVLDKDLHSPWAQCTTSRHTDRSISTMSWRILMTGSRQDPTLPRLIATK